MKRILVLGICALSAISLFPRPARAVDAAAHPGVQAAHTFEGKIALKYLLYLPKEYGKEPDKKWPLMLFLHGSGERGSDVQKVAIHGPPKHAAAGKDFPFIIVSPQCPEKEWWDPTTLSRLLDDLQAKYAVDADRLYLTGLSMGGFGTFEMATRYPEKFAAIAPVCGGGDPARARRLRNVPTWVFHGEDDKAVPIARSEAMVNAMKEAGATQVQFTRYPNVGHDSWNPAYNDPKLYEWFLSHKQNHGPVTKPGN